MNREYSTSFYTRSRKSDRDRKPEHSSAPPDILDVLDALTRLGYKHTGSNGNRRAQCPAHDGGGLNLSIRKGDGGRTLLTCWSRQCSYREIMHALGFGLGKPIAGTARPDRPARAAPKPAEPNPGIARAIWDAAKPATGTIAHDYLAGRYVWPPPELGVSLPDSIRYLATADAPARIRGWGGLFDAPSVGLRPIAKRIAFELSGRCAAGKAKRGGSVETLVTLRDMAKAAAVPKPPADPAGALAQWSRKVLTRISHQPALAPVYSGR